MILKFILMKAFIIDCFSFQRLFTGVWQQDRK